jgi:hypothetical protein
MVKEKKEKKQKEQRKRIKKSEAIEREIDRCYTVYFNIPFFVCTFYKKRERERKEIAKHEKNTQISL